MRRECDHGNKVRAEASTYAHHNGVCAKHACASLLLSWVGACKLLAVEGGAGVQARGAELLWGAKIARGMNPATPFPPSRVGAVQAEVL